MDKDDIEPPEMDARNDDSAHTESDEPKMEDNQEDHAEPVTIVDWASI